MRRGSFRRGGRRPRKNWIWTGIQGSATITNAATTIIEVANPALWSAINLPGEGTVTRVRMNFGGNNAAAANNAESALYYYLDVFPTDLTGSTPGAIINDPSSTDADLMDKHFMLMGLRRFSGVPADANARQPENWSEDVKAKRRVNGESLLGLVLRSTSASGVTIHYQIRALVSCGTR